MSTVSGTSKVGHKPDPISQDASDDGMKTALERLMSEASTFDKLRDQTSTADQLAGYSDGGNFGSAQLEQTPQMWRQVGPNENLGGNGTPPPTSEPDSDPTPAPSPSFDGDDRDPPPSTPVVTPTANPNEPPSEINNPSIGPFPDTTTLPPSTRPIPGPIFDEDDRPPLTADPDKPPSETNNPSNGPFPDTTTLPPSTRPLPSDEEDSPKPVSGVNAAGSVSIGTSAGGGFFGWLRPIVPNLLKPIVSAFTTAVGIATGAVVSGVSLLLYPRPMGGRPDTIVSQSMNVNIVASTGELIIDGEASGIHVIPVRYDNYGNPTGFGPASLGDAEDLSNLLGTPVNVGEPLGVIVNNDGVSDDGVEESAEVAINHDAEYPPDPSQIEHIFGDRPGHIPDTEENRGIVQDAVNEENFQGTNQFGNQVYHEVNNDGSQTWVHVRNGVIQNAGVNAPGNHY